MLTSPQHLPADRVLAARAAASRMSLSMVRVGYVAAALARAGNHGGHPGGAASGGMSSSSGNAGVAAAAVRAAAAHSSMTAPEDGSGSLTPRRLSFAPLAATEAQPAAACEREAVHAEEDSLVTAAEPAVADSADAGSTDAESQEEERGEEATPTICGASNSATVTSEPTNSEGPLSTIVVGPANDEHEAVSDAEGVWDVVVKRTFISVVHRRQGLEHSASAPGCLGILGEAGRSVRQRRQRSSNRRSRRRRAGTEQAGAGNNVELH